MITADKSMLVATVLSIVVVAVYSGKCNAPDRVTGVWKFQAIPAPFCPDAQAPDSVLSDAEHEKMFEKVTQCCHSFNGDAVKAPAFQLTFSKASANIPEQPDYMNAVLKGFPHILGMWKTEESSNTMTVTVKTLSPGFTNGNTHPVLPGFFKGLKIERVVVIHVKRERNCVTAPDDMTELQIQETPEFFDYSFKFGASPMAVIYKNETDGTTSYYYKCLKVAHDFK